MDDPEHGTVARVCLYLSLSSHASEKTNVTHRCDPRYSEVWRYCAYMSANARVTPYSPGDFRSNVSPRSWKEVDRMAPRVIAAETIAAISYSANSLSSHPRRFETVGTPGNVHPGNFGVVLLVPSLLSPSYNGRSGALSHFPMKGALREKHLLTRWRNFRSDRRDFRYRRGQPWSTSRRPSGPEEDPWKFTERREKSIVPFDLYAALTLPMTV